MRKAFKTEIKPNSSQSIKINKTIGVCRYVYNFYLNESMKHYRNTGKFLSGYDFSKWLNNVYLINNDPWIKDVSSKAVKQSIMNGDRAFKKFFKGESYFPKFKKKNSNNTKVYLPKNNKKDWEVERHRVKIPTLGWVRLKEYGYIPSNAKIKSGTISVRAGRYYVSVLCEVEDTRNKNINKSEGLGVDLGIKEFAIISNGKIFGNVNKSDEIKKTQRKLKREQKSLSRKMNNLKTKGGATASKNIDKNKVKVQKLNVRLTNIRDEHIRSVVDYLIKQKPQFITIEDLNTKGILKNRNLSKSIINQKFYYFKDWLTKKCIQNDIELRIVDRFFPSSKICSGCGFKKDVLSLSDRLYQCENCGLEIDRDLNASINLKNAKEYKIITTR